MSVVRKGKAGLLQMTLAKWNAMSASEAAEAALPCSGSRAWARGVAERRPYGTVEDLAKAADEVWWGLGEADWQEAFDSHPRIGQTKAKAATAESLAWSAGEQAQVEDAAKAALAEANAEYEARFGRIFIVCATGKTAAEMLGILRERMKNGNATELREAAEQQRQITQLRIRKWMRA